MKHTLHRIQQISVDLDFRELREGYFVFELAEGNDLFVRARTHFLFQMVVAGTFFDRVIKLLYCVSETGSSHSFVASGCSWV